MDNDKDLTYRMAKLAREICRVDPNHPAVNLLLWPLNARCPECDGTWEIRAAPGWSGVYPCARCGEG